MHRHDHSRAYRHAPPPKSDLDDRQLSVWLDDGGRDHSDSDDD